MDVKEEKTAVVFFTILQNRCEVSVRVNTVPMKLSMPSLFRSGDFKERAKLIFLKGWRHFAIYLLCTVPPCKWFLDELEAFGKTSKRLKSVTLLRCGPESVHITSTFFEIAGINPATKTVRIYGTPEFFRSKRVLSFSALETTSTLRTLDLSDSNISEVNLKSLLSVLMHENRSVKNLSVSENVLTDTLAEHVWHVLHFNPVIRRLRMEKTFVSTKLANAIIKKIRVQDRLKEFYISNNIECYDSLVKLVTHVKNLKCLSISGMLDTERNCDDFTEVLKTSNESVKTFICTQDQFTNPSFKNILENSHLKYVYLPALSLVFVDADNVRLANENEKIKFLGDHPQDLFSRVTNRNLHNAAIRKTLLASLFF
ncbi:MAG: hypothetical protein Q8P67_07165 [archaeon]|nr:hypothetical protein [archaeon]